MTTETTARYLLAATTRAVDSAPTVDHVIARLDQFSHTEIWLRKVLEAELAEAFHAGVMVGICHSPDAPFPHPYG